MTLSLSRPGSRQDERPGALFRRFPQTVEYFAVEVARDQYVADNKVRGIVVRSEKEGNTGKHSAEDVSHDREAGSLERASSCVVPHAGIVTMRADSATQLGLRLEISWKTVYSRWVVRVIIPMDLS